MYAPGPSLAGEKAFAPGGKPFYGGDLESGPDALYPGITVSEQGLRWGFIQKVRPLAVRARLALRVRARGRRAHGLRARTWLAREGCLCAKGRAKGREERARPARSAGKACFRVPPAASDQPRARQAPLVPGPVAACVAAVTLVW